MKKIIKRLIVINLFISLVTTLLIGCGMSDRQRENRLKELLKDKYGEDFVVREMYVTGGVEAYCYPVNNPDIIFKIETSLEMDVIEMDYYLQRLVCIQLEEELQPKIEEIYPGCYVSVHMDVGSTTNYDNYIENGVSPKLLIDYMRDDNLLDSITVTIFADKESLTNKLECDDWQKLKKDIIAIAEEANNPNIILDIYGFDSTKIIKAREIIKEINWDSSGILEKDDIYDIKRDSNKIRIIIDNNEKIYILNDFGEKVEFENNIFIEQMGNL